MLLGINAVWIFTDLNIYVDEVTVCVAVVYAILEIVALIVSLKNAAKNDFTPKKHIFSDIAVLNTVSLTSSLVLDAGSLFIEDVFPFDLFSLIVAGVLTVVAMVILTVIFVISLLAMLSKFLKKEKISLQKGSLITGCVSVALSVAVTFILGESSALLLIPLCAGAAIINVQINRIYLFDNKGA